MQSSPFRFRSIFITWCIVLLFTPSEVWSQVSDRNQGAALVPSFSYAAHVPVGALAKRYGTVFSPGVEVHWLTRQTNWLIGIQGQFIFGSQVKEDVLAGLRTESGYIIGNDRLPADLQLRMRGGYLGIQAGKLWSLAADNPRSGIRYSMGAGWLYHQIRIQKDPSRFVAQVEGDYGRGYDRLSGGPALYQWIGYQVFSKNGQVNVYVGIEGLLGISKSLRSYQFDLHGPEAGNQLDQLWGIRAGLAMPWYSGKGRQIWY